MEGGSGGQRVTQGGDSAAGWLPATCLPLGTLTGDGIVPEPSALRYPGWGGVVPAGADGTGKEAPWEAACCFLTLGRGRIPASIPSSRRHTLSQLLLTERRAAKKTPAMDVAATPSPSLRP